MGASPTRTHAFLTYIHPPLFPQLSHVPGNSHIHIKRPRLSPGFRILFPYSSPDLLANQSSTNFPTKPPGNKYIPANIIYWLSDAKPPTSNSELLLSPRTTHINCKLTQLYLPGSLCGSLFCFRVGYRLDTNSTSATRTNNAWPNSIPHSSFT